jgi:hypothetical protein
MINKEVLDTVGFAKDIILGIAGATTAVVAVIGLKKWRSELKGKTYFEVSFKLLKTVYTLRDRLMSARSSYTAVNEMLVKTPDMQNYERENLHYVLGARLKPVQQTLNEFYSCLPEAEALFGKEFKKTCMEINGIIWEY